MQDLSIPSLLLDVLVIAVTVGFVWYGIRRGFLVMLVGTCGRLISCFGAYVGSRAEELAGYLLKEQQTGNSKRAWGASKGLIKPEIFEEEISAEEYRKGVEEEMRDAGDVYTLVGCTRYYDAWSGEDIVYAVYYKSAKKKGRKRSAGRRNGCGVRLRC